MKRALITGINGFAGTYLSLHLTGRGWDVTGLDRHPFPAEKYSMHTREWTWHQADSIPRFFQNDLSDFTSIEAIQKEEKFDYVFHIAGMAFVPDSWKDPGAAISDNTVITANLIHGLIRGGFTGRFLYISSSDVYGSISDAVRPIDENDPLRPESPYAVSKIAAEQLTLLFGNNSLDCVIARPFNHTGPGQRDSFVVPAFLRRITDAIHSGSDKIVVGELESTRDFTDVRDIVSAYEMLILKGERKGIYNVCSGNPVSIGDILKTSMKIAGKELRTEVDPGLLRPEGPTHRFGSPQKLRSLGWEQKYPLEQTLADIWTTMH